MAETPDLVLRAASRLARPELTPTLADDRAGFARPKPQGRVAAQAQPLTPVPETAAAPKSAAPVAPPARSVVLSQAMLAASGIALPSAGFSRQVEEFRSIKRQVLASILRGASADGANRLLMVTSAVPSEGKTHVSINLALAIAFERDYSVLLVDADAHRQSLVSRLGIHADTGWLDTLTDDSIKPSDVIIGTNIPNLTILPAGKARAEIPELMSSRKMGDMLRQLAGENPNRLVIFDSLPCLVSTEPTILASHVGQVLFVVAASETSKDEIESSLRLLEGCPTINLILNKGDPLLIDQFGKYGYGYGYQNKG
jgi:receptor protein-tyrosine kinase